MKKERRVSFPSSSDRLTGRILLLVNYRSYQLWQNLLRDGSILMMLTKISQKVCAESSKNYRLHEKPQQRIGFRKKLHSMSNNTMTTLCLPLISPFDLIPAVGPAQ